MSVCFRLWSVFAFFSHGVSIQRAINPSCLSHFRLIREKRASTWLWTMRLVINVRPNEGEIKNNSTTNPNHQLRAADERDKALRCPMMLKSNHHQDSSHCILFIKCFIHHKPPSRHSCSRWLSWTTTVTLSAFRSANGVSLRGTEALKFRITQFNASSFLA